MYSHENKAAWTDERTNTLKKLWAEGNSCSVIARQLGGITRNAVIGKIHRLGLSGHVTTQRKKQAPWFRRARKAKAVRAGIARAKTWREIAKSLPQHPLPPPTVADVARVQLLDLESHHCRWPVGEPTQGFCGCTAVPSLPYCAGHAHRAYRAPMGAKSNYIGNPTVISRGVLGGMIRSDVLKFADVEDFVS